MFMRITMFLTRKDPGMVRMRIAIFLITNGERSPRDNFLYRERNTARHSDTMNEGSGEARESKPTDQQEKEVPMVAHIAEFSQKKEETVELVHNLVPEVETGNDNGVGEDFQDLSDEESEVKGAIYYDPDADGDEVGNEENKEEGEIEKSHVESETVKKRGAKKKLFKNVGIGAGVPQSRDWYKALYVHASVRRLRMDLARERASSRWMIRVP
ncbi:hypothetical protein HID58_066849 [Brassica napus]|uniref:Uncharacterized protein n=1 Tax=Brassica napus TaxID=3708 RepID=A0ABQ7ZGU9_BRANA|nr:hypothetical protein HID58_066849 [Brassica napus]